MAPYRKRKGTDTWHFCSNCSNYPTAAESETSSSKPSGGELCNECRSKKEKDNCS